MENNKKEMTIEEMIAAKESELSRLKKQYSNEKDTTKQSAIKAKCDNVSNEINRLNEERERRIYNTIIITPDQDDKDSLYKIIGKIEFSIDIKEVNTENGDIEEKIEVQGKLVTNIMLESTKIDVIDTWRYALNKVVINKIQCTSMNDNIMYTFTAEGFDVKA